MTERAYLARHLRNLSLRLMEDGLEVCRELDPDLRPTWGSLIGHLDRQGPIGVMEAARLLDVSHVHIQKTFAGMMSAGVVVAHDDPNDRRRTNYSLTQKGQSLLPKIAQVNSAMLSVVDDIAHETGDDLFKALTSFKTALDKVGWQDRIKDKLVNVEKS